MKNLPVSILVIDDDEDDFFIIKQYLEKVQGYAFTIDWCNIYNDAEKLICQSKYDLYLVDYFLGAKTGMNLIEESITNNCEEPFILLTGNGNRAIEIQAIESGAVDYLIKGELSIEKLERCIRYSLERASAIKALRGSERKFRNIFERSKDIVFIADEKLSFTEVNNASLKLLEYSRSELLTKDLASLLANKSDAGIINMQLKEKGEVSDKEVELLTKSGEKKYCILTLSRETDIKGAKYAQGIIHDITALKRAEKSTLMLEKVGLANRLVRMMAHEVRNPLNNIMLSAEEMYHDLDDAEFKICLDIITRNSKRIEGLIAELVNSSKDNHVHVEKKSLQSILNEALNHAIDRIKLRHIDLQTDFVEAPAWVMADNEKLKIAFLNIIINAIEAMNENEGKLNIAVKQKNGQYIV